MARSPPVHRRADARPRLRFNLAGHSLCALCTCGLFDLCSLRTPVFVHASDRSRGATPTKATAAARSKETFVPRGRQRHPLDDYDQHPALLAQKVPSAAAALLLGALALTGLWPAGAWAADRTVAPPTCVSIENAVKNCPGRTADGAIQNAEARRAEAAQMLEAAEKEAGKKLYPGEAKGEPEYFNFWDAEVKRLVMNQKYLADIRPRLQATAPAGEKPLRLVSRLLVRSDDVDQEANFWCEAVGMQIYGDTPTGGKVVAFGPPGILKGDEGGFFAVQIEPKAASAASGKPASQTSGLRLSFVQVATPALIRISKVISNGGELLDGYGYYGLRSPSGVQIRAYVEDRRDPVEFVAVVPATTDGLKGATGQIESLGFESRGQYKLVNKFTQEYMPELPPGNVLYTSGDPEKSAQLLLSPLVKEEEKSILENLPSGVGFVQDQDSRPQFDVMEQPEKPTSPVSEIRDARLFITGASGPSSYATATSPGSELLSLELQRVE